MNRFLPESNVGYGDLLVFIGLVLGLSWLQFIPPYLVGSMGVDVPASVGLVLGIVFMFSPLIAALVLITWGSATEDPGSFLRERFRWRVSLSWYLIALILLPVLAGIAAALFIMQGESVPIDETHATLLVLVFTQGLIANLFENYGWRGYLQEGLQAAQSAFVASLVVGVVWGLWHAPLLLVEGAALSAIPFSWYMALLIGLAVLFGWVYNETGGSVLLVTLMHCVFNGSIGLITVSLIETGGDVAGFITLSTILIWIAVGALLVRTDSETLTRVPVSR